MKANTPKEFDQIGLDSERFRRFGRTEWHGPCPICGGEDRFVIWTNRRFPSWRWFCRKCNPEGGWLDQLRPELKKELTPEEKARYAAENAARLARELEEKIRQAQEALKELRDTHKWEQYHDNLDESSRQMWLDCGVPEFFQDWWQLGYDPDHVVFYKEKEYHTPTLTIPLFEARTWNVLNVKHRLMKPPTKNDRYRPEKSGLPATPFVANPDLEICGKTLMVEGEKKCMVSFIASDDPNLQAVGIPGKDASDSILSLFKDCDPIYICLDPDAEVKAIDIANKLSRERCRVIELPDKIDDMIIRHHLGKEFIDSLFRHARVV